MIVDTIVAGAGGMGSAAAFHLASRGQRVLVLERFGLGHDRGSSHGLTRIIRLAYFEHPSYVPLLRRAFALWRALEHRCGEQLLHVTGGLDVGMEGGIVFEGSRRSCVAHDLPHARRVLARAHPVLEGLERRLATRRRLAWTIAAGGEEQHDERARHAAIVADQ